MSSPIGSIASLAGTAISTAAKGAGSGSGFQDLLESAINRVESLKQTADQSVQRVLSGEGEELHTAVLATERAELAFELFMQVRNKVTSAYQEIMRMQI
jgi:flagellar hook-basal body complex protein FliE